MVAQGGLILASRSPRRRQLLSYLTENFSVQPADIDEQIRASEPPKTYVLRMAKEKADVLTKRYADRWILAADTVVFQGEILLDKPKDKGEFLKNFELLSDSMHQVVTAVTLMRGGHDPSCHQIAVSASVWFTSVCQQRAEAYWSTGEPQDKAGGYAVQGAGQQFIKRIDGSYSAIVGLPLVETAQLLTQIGYLK